MKLFNLIEQNNSLTFFDFTTQESFSEISSLRYKNEMQSEDKKLVFLYLDNSLDSIKLYLHFLSSPHAIALLSNSINDNLKISLESKYLPDLIIDSKRSSINSYQVVENYLGIQNKFESLKQHKHKLSAELKLLLSTSGTTGSPKFVKLSEENLIANAKSILQYLPINSKDVCPLNLPIHYSYGLSVLHTNAIAGGKMYCSLPDIMQKNFWLAMDEYGFTSIAGVPFVYEMLKRIGFTKKQYPSLKYITQAGGKLNDDLVMHYKEYAQNNSIAFFVMYGQTEATARMSYLNPSMLDSKLGSIGKAIPGGTFSLEKETNQLIYKGENVFGGYAESNTDLVTYNKTDLLLTGDIARVDDDGYYYIIGRVKRFIKLFGNRINLDEIEQSLKNVFQSASFVAFGSNDQVMYVIYNNAALDKNAIIEHLKSEFSIHHSSFKIEYLEEIPLTSNGKIDYTKLKSDYGVN